MDGSKFIDFSNMSNLRINIRFFQWHFQVTYDWKFSVEYNELHKGLPDGWFEIYEFRLK